MWGLCFSTTLRPRDAICEIKCYQPSLGISTCDDRTLATAWGLRHPDEAGPMAVNCPGPPPRCSPLSTPNPPSAFSPLLMALILDPGCLGSNSALPHLVVSPESSGLNSLCCVLICNALQAFGGCPASCGVHGGTLRAGCGWCFIREIHGCCAWRWVVCCDRHAEDSTGCTGQSVLLVTPSRLSHLLAVNPDRRHTHPIPLPIRWSGIVGSWVGRCLVLVDGCPR